jgi:hypothetical protein
MPRKNARIFIISILAGGIGLTTIGCSNSTISSPPSSPTTNSPPTAIATTSATEKPAPIAISNTPVVSHEPIKPQASSNTVPVNPEPETAPTPIATTEVTPAPITGRQETQIETADYPEITNGMPYSTFQRAAAAKGWQPNRSPNCTANVEPGSALCEQLPELQSCDQNFCQMVFNRGRTTKFITLKVFGGNRDQNATGRDSKWRVISWSIDNDNSQP